jgi:UDP-glucose 4-epimerase
MRVLVTGSAGHLGEALMRTLPAAGHEPVGVDITPSSFTQHVGSIADRAFAGECLRGATAVVHAATLHKPHVATHSRQDFVDTNVTGTLNLLEESVRAGIQAFVFTSTTSAFGHPPARRPPGSPRTSSRFPRTSTALPRWRPKSCASCSTSGSASRA